MAGQSPNTFTSNRDCCAGVVKYILFSMFPQGMSIAANTSVGNTSIAGGCIGWSRCGDIDEYYVVVVLRVINVHCNSVLGTTQWSLLLSI